MSPRISIGKEQAIQIYDTEWWKEKSYREIAFYQLFTAEIICPFDVFLYALGKSLNRKLDEHDLGWNYTGICRDFLGQRAESTFQDILKLPQQNLLEFQNNEQHLQLLLH